MVRRLDTTTGTQQVIDEFITAWNEGDDILTTPTPDQRDKVTQEFHKIITGMHTEKPRDYVGLSACGEHELLLCLKKLGFTETFSHKTRMIFFTGHLWEALIIDAMRSFGIEVKGQQETLLYESFKGHIDGMFEDHLLELKTMSDKSFKAFTKDPMRNLKYVYQLGVYARCCDTNKAGWICLNKQTMELAYVPYPFHEQQRVLDDVVRKSQVLDCINGLDDLKYILVPEGRPEVFKKEQTGKMLVPMFMNFSPYKEAFYELYTDTNGYGKETTYVKGVRPWSYTKEWLLNYKEEQ